MELFNKLNESRIYLSEEIIKKYLTKGKGKHSLNNFHKQILLKGDYEEGVDYWKATLEEKNEMCVRANLKTSQNKNKKRYFVSPECFKLLIISSGISNRSKKYFVNLESATVKYIKYQAKFKNKKLNDEIKYMKSLPHIKQFMRMQAIREIKNNQKVGCVYFIIEEGDPSYVKIGFTYHLPTRLKMLQVANRRNLVVRASFLCMYPELEEYRLHKKYSEFKVRGEWFKIDPSSMSIDQL